MIRSNKLLIVTDLDATLLEEDYTYGAALPAIQQLKEVGFPIVLNSSKTLAELADLSCELDLRAPVIAENGGQIAFPAAYFSELESDEGFQRNGDFYAAVFGLSRHDIIQHAHLLREQYGYDFEGFADWSTEKICAHTGLDESSAARAADRYVTEPILWHDTEERRSEFLQQMETIGARALLGGRFIHLMGRVDKADGLRRVKSFYEKREPKFIWQTVALGDSPNDQEMLNAADTAVIIPHVTGARLTETMAPQTVRASQPASRGWNESILQLLKQLD